MKVFTDYPITELGDFPNMLAPIREAHVCSYDQNKYCRVVVEGVITDIKAGYLYERYGRSGDVPAVPRNKLLELPKREAA